MPPNCWRWHRIWRRVSTIPLIATRGAAPTERSVEDRAMVLLSTIPVLGADGETLALLRGGVLLNQNLPLDRPYQPHRLPGSAPCRWAAMARRPCSWATCASRPMCACSRTSARSARGYRRPCVMRCWPRCHLAGPGLCRQRLVCVRIRAADAMPPANVSACCTSATWRSRFAWSSTPCWRSSSPSSCS